MPSRNNYRAVASGTTYTWASRGRLALPRGTTTTTGGGGTTPPPGGGGNVVPPGGGNLSYWLPFDMPDRQTLASSDRKAFAHYFTPYPISINNSYNWYQQRWEPQGSNPFEGGTHWELYGGFLRDEPKNAARAISSATNWRELDKTDEVRWAVEAGLDGFTVDLLNLTDRQTQVQELMRAVGIVGESTFKLVPSPDGNGAATADVNALADALAVMAKDPSAFKLPDGRYVVAPFAPERAPQHAGPTGATSWGPTNWQAMLNRLNTTYGVPTAFWPYYVLDWSGTTQAQAFNAMAYGHSRWGDRDPTSVSANSVNNRTAMSYTRTTFPGKKWMHPVAVQDYRAKDHTYWEPWCSETLRASWTAAIDGAADWVQIPTWSDFSEHAHVVPSKNHGYVWLDISAYYLTWFKTGNRPTITRDVIYLIHRVQKTSGMTFTGPQTTFATWAGNGMAPRDDIEVLCFLTAPADVTITVGGTPTKFTNVAAGSPVSLKIPLAAGQVSASATRAGTQFATVTTGPANAVSTTTAWGQDLHLRAAGSLR
jgi:hypothetical protein